MFAVVAGGRGRDRAQVEAALRAAGITPVDAHASPSLAVLIEDAAHPPWPSAPTIVISSKTDIDSFTNAITSGAGRLSAPARGRPRVDRGRPPPRALEAARRPV